jgi:Uma2 family endonuclease
MVTAAPALTGIEMDECEYLETLANAKRFEFTNGVVTAKRGPYMTQKKHVFAAEELSAAFREYRLRVGGAGGQTPTTNVSANKDRLYRLPDYAYWAPGRPVGDSIFEPPTAAIEVASPDQRVDDLRAKCRLYRERGVDVCWLIEPERRWVEVWDEGRDGVRLADDAAMESAALPGFRLPIQQLWDAIDAAPA